MVDLALGVDVLARADNHGLGRCHVDEGRLAGVGVRDPEGDGEAVGGASEEDGDGAREVDEEGGGAIVKGWSNEVLAGALETALWETEVVLRTMDIGARREGRVVGQSLGDVVVGAVDVVVFLRQSS